MKRCPECLSPIEEMEGVEFYRHPCHRESEPPHLVNYIRWGEVRRGDLLSDEDEESQ